MSPKLFDRKPARERLLKGDQVACLAQGAQLERREMFSEQIEIPGEDFMPPRPIRSGLWKTTTRFYVADSFSISRFPQHTLYDTTRKHCLASKDEAEIAKNLRA